MYSFENSAAMFGQGNMYMAVDPAAWSQNPYHQRAYGNSATFTIGEITIDEKTETLHNGTFYELLDEFRGLVERF